MNKDENIAHLQTMIFDHWHSLTGEQKELIKLEAQGFVNGMAFANALCNLCEALDDSGVEWRKNVL